MATIGRLPIPAGICSQSSCSPANGGVRRPRRRRRVLVLGLAIALVTAASVAAVPAASAQTPDDSGAYSTARSTSEDHSDWLAQVNSSTPIWQLSIPGTHDAYTGQASNLPWGDTTQTLPVSEQLKMGIRALDMRLKNCVMDKGAGCPGDGTDFWVEHGGNGLGITLSGMLTQLQTFLAAHPNEFFIVRVKVEGTGDPTTFAARWNQILDEYSGILWSGTQDEGTFANPTLDQVRGKIVLLQEVSPDQGVTLPVNNYGMTMGTPGLVIEDHFSYPDISGVFQKWGYILSNWTAAVAYAKTGGTSNGYITNISASSTGLGSAPADFAGAESFLLSNDYSAEWPDAHSAQCNAGTFSCAYYTGTNIVMYDALSQQNNAGRNHPWLSTQDGMGLIFINFPGQPLVNAILANNPGVGPTGRIASSLISNLCVDNDNGVGSWGNVVRSWACDSFAPAQKWTLNPHNTVNIGGGCLEIKGLGDVDYTPIDWRSCNGGPNQQWQVTASGQLLNPATGKCLSSAPAPNAPLFLSTCNQNQNLPFLQQWTVPGASTGAIVSQVPKPTDSAKCVDLYHSQTINGTKVQMWSCDLTNAQNWTLNSDGTVRILDGCLEIRGLGDADGTPIDWWSCNGVANQQWQVTASGELLNPTSSKCLDDPNSSTTDGTQLDLRTCNQTNAQKWYFPTF
jgi:hypothetical protein